MTKNIDLDNDFRRAMILLKDRINTVVDLVRLWSYSGPCSERCPSIEKISKKR